MKQNLYNNTALNYNRGVVVLNMFLVATTVFLIIYYVTISNTITSSKYKLSLLEKKLTDLIEKNSFLTAQKLSVDNFSAILGFAGTYRLVETRHVTHMFEKSGVAIQR